MTRAAFDRFLNGQAGAEVPLVPMFEDLASRVGSLGAEDMIADAGAWSSNLAKTGKLLSADALVLGFGAGAASYRDAVKGGASALETAGVTTALDAFDRLVKTEQSFTGCIASITGPMTLGAEVPDAADLKHSLVEIAEAFCKTRPDLLLFREGNALGGQDVSMAERKAYNTIKNMASYYSVPLGIYLEDYVPSMIPSLAKLKVPYIFLGADKAGNLPDLSLLRDLAAEVDGIGVPINFTDAQAARQQAQDACNTLKGANILFTHSGELGREIDLEATLELIKDLREMGS
ncbi:hypothetical protein GCM10017044_05160 [Kordiimonas sediminis]|uniref:Uncharacterized protein n=1 Tax=Kordiimonas sediminis TaxID=1735581 RepID=A0A919AKN3_9PROT|nr:hypothetical protein [Kordiimonas sediminis]GHF14037.1 hypothetical protein GCM10017044_05160 [Kordiimonas sediminis]